MSRKKRNKNVFTNYFRVFFLWVYKKKELENWTLKTFSSQRQEEFNCAVVKFIAFYGIQ